MAGRIVTVSDLRSVRGGVCDAAQLADRNFNSARATRLPGSPTRVST